MIEQQEKSGDYGAAIRGDEATVAWSKETDLAGTEAGRVPVDGPNRFALTVGGVLLIALVLLCFRLAYDGVKTNVQSRGFTGKEYLSEEPDTYAGPRAPASAANLPPVNTRVIPPPVTQAPPVTVAAPGPSVATVPAAVFPSDTDRERVTGLLTDCRAAYNASGEVSKKWFGASDNMRSVQRLNAEGTTTGDLQPSSGRPLSTKELNSIDTQMEGLSATVALATQPARYPVALQETSVGLRREMHTYLQTARAALVQSDPQKRSQIQARADTHRQKAGQLLTALESAVKNGTVIPEEAGNGE